MRTKFFLSVFALFFASSTLFAQAVKVIDFETDETGKGFNWVVDQNLDNPALEFVANPKKDDVNGSNTVCKFTVKKGGMAWALFYTDDLGTFTLDENNAKVRIKILKEKISDVDIKLELPEEDATEIRKPNTKTGEWEIMEFNFSTKIGESYSRLVVIPDFEERTADNIVYIDDIEFVKGEVIVINEPQESAPDPIHDANSVISIFSNKYPNIAGTDFNPFWGQSTKVSFPTLFDDKLMCYKDLNYQGIQIGQTLNLTNDGMTHVHVDVWNAYSNKLDIYLISGENPNIQEKSYNLYSEKNPIDKEKWVSFDIPLSHFSDVVNLNDVNQFKFAGDGVVYLDNLYFYKDVTGVEDKSLITSFNLEQNYPNPFNPTTNIKFNLPTSSFVTLKVYNMLGQEVTTLVNNQLNAGTHTISFEANNLPSGTYFYKLTAGNFTSVKKMLLMK